MSLLLCRTLLRLHLLPTPLLRTLATTASTSSPPPHQLSSSSSSFTVDFLTTSCGLTPAQALSAARTIHLDQETRQQAESVLAVLRAHGFSNAQIAEVVARRPRFLFSRVQSNLGPKLQFLTQMGFSSALIAKVPSVLCRSLDRRIRPSLEFLRRFLGRAEDVHTLFRHHKWGLCYLDLKKTMTPNVGLLLELGVAAPAISRLMVSHPRALLRNHERFAEIVQIVQEWGLKPDKKTFLRAVRAVSGLSKSNRAARLELFKKLGWSEEEVMSAFQRDPLCLLTSEQKLMRMNSFAGKLGLGPSVLSRRPTLIMFSFERRILPRYAVWQFLTTKGLIEQGTDKLLSMFDTSEKAFLDRYVTTYMDQAPRLMDVYLGKIQVEGFDVGGEEGSSTGRKL